MALSDELIDSAAIACTPAGLESRLADYESLGADTLLCMPFGDRPAIVDALVAANRAYASA
ncbi:MAG: hypothetical protein H0T15_10180 [Thermoleophilaceae bacterium]|nr:hypothetical protein [Thermoleophilaceae bacterium]